MSEGRRDDSGKLRFDLIPPEVLIGYARAATYGAYKYDERNCEQGFSWGRAFGSAMRHLWKFWGREECDVESGIHHLDMALWNVGMLLVFMRRRLGADDRGDPMGDNFALHFDPSIVEKKITRRHEKKTKLHGIL